MRKSTQLFLILPAQWAIAALHWFHGSLGAADAAQRLADERWLVGRLMLTDLALFTEARYTRHLSQAGLNTPFQDFPMALEHFPSGSFAQPALGHFEQGP
jgi:hypothetical protein